MKDYQIQVKIRNGRILQMMQRQGLGRVKDLAKKLKCSPTELYDILNFKISPIRNDGKWRRIAVKLSDFFLIPPDELFPEHMQHVLDINVSTRFLDKTELLPYASQIQIDFENKVEASIMLSEVLENSGISRAAQEIIKMRFYEGLTLKETAEAMSVSIERIRQIEAKALRMLRQPPRSNKLKEAYFEI